jgi:hypothetical protein
MYEIAIMGPEDIDEQGAEYLAYLQSRLPQLLEIAHKLVQASWTPALRLPSGRDSAVLRPIVPIDFGSMGRSRHSAGRPESRFSTLFDWS